MARLLFEKLKRSLIKIVKLSKNFVLNDMLFRSKVLKLLVTENNSKLQLAFKKNIAFSNDMLILCIDLHVKTMFLFSFHFAS